MLTASEIGAKKMGHSATTHALKYSNVQVGEEEEHYNKYHSGIGDRSHATLLDKDHLSCHHLQKAMMLRHNQGYMSEAQKELVESMYRMIHAGGPYMHYLGLLAPGEGKSEVYIIPTLARILSNHLHKTILHVSPYLFLAGYQFDNALKAFEKVGYQDHVSILTFTGGDIQEGFLPTELSNKDTLPSLLFLSLDAMYNLFTYFPEELTSWKKNVGERFTLSITPRVALRRAAVKTLNGPTVGS